jgi:hypothetical protein
MKKLIILLTVLGLAGIGFSAWLGSGQAQAPRREIVSNTSAGTIIDIEIPGVNTEAIEAQGTIYQNVSIPGEVLAALDVGKPQVPKLSLLLGTPDNAGVTVTMTPLESKTFDNVLCYPYQTPLTDNANNPFVIDREFYTSDEFYPSYSARVMNTGIWRDLSVATIEVMPVHYNPALKQLRVDTRVRVNVSYSGPGYTHKQIKPWLAGAYARFIDNFGNLDIAIGGADNPGVKYLVVAHDNWYNNPALESLLAWHYKQGIESRVIHKASWTPSEIRDSILAEYNRSTPAELRWVLLVGEYAEIPMQSLGGVGHGDYYYSDVLPTSPDNYPEIGLSRLSPASPMDLQNQVAKILKYEKNPPTTDNWLSKHALIACSELYPDKYSACIRGIYNEPMGFYRYNFDTLMCQYHGNDSITRIINEGRAAVTYRGHGAWDEWYTLASQGGTPWYIANVDALTNGDLTPMTFNIACECGDIAQATCLGEEWLRKYPGGGVGAFAATQASYTYPNHGICSTLVRSLCDTWTITVPGVRDYALPAFDIGSIQDNVDAYVAKYWPASPYPDNIYMYINLGDPAMEVWSGGMPATANVTYPPAIPVGPYNLPISVQANGAPVKGALVCAWKGAEFYVIGHTDNNGEVTLSINSTSPGQFYVTVSGGHALANPPSPIFPFEGTCLARTSNTPYVVHLRHGIDDAPPGGNGDGVVNPGENINMPTWVKNLGQQTGTGVTGTLRTADPAASVTDSVKTFGTIPANDSAFTGSNGFKFLAGDTCTNGHNIPFTLVCKDVNDSIWNSTFSVRVGTPILGYQGKRVYDPPPGGNGNGRIDPGETAQLYFGVENIGLGNGYNVRGILRSGNPLFTVTDSIGVYGTVPHDTFIENSADPFVVQADPSILPETPIPCTLHVYADGGYHGVFVPTIVVGEIRANDPIPDNMTPPLYYAYDNVDSNYTERPDYNWIEIRGVGTVITLSDDQTVPVSLPPAFGPFKYYGQSYSIISVCGNGFVMPGSNTVAPWTNAGLPNSGVAAPMICLNWDDLYPPVGDSVRYYHDAANHVFVVEYDSVSYYPSGSGLYDKYELVIYDTTLAAIDGNSKFVVQYMTADHYTSSTMGIQAPTTSYGIQCLFDAAYNRGTAPLAAHSAIKYTTNRPLTAIAERPANSQLGTRNPRFAISPNPFNGRALIRWQVQTAGHVSLTVFDAAGRAIRKLVNADLKPGPYDVTWNGADDLGRPISSGIYFYKLTTPDYKLSAKTTLLR